MKEKGEISLAMWSWWVVSVTSQMLVILGIMIYGWGLEPKSWRIVVGGYILIQVIWPITIWFRILFFKALGVGPTQTKGGKKLERNTRKGNQEEDLWQGQN